MKRHLGSFLVVSCIVLFVAASTAAEGSGEVAEMRSTIEALRSEIESLRESLRESRAVLERLQRLQGMEHYRFPRSFELFGQRFPLEERSLWERMDREFLVMVDDVAQVLLWIKRANRYFPLVQAQVAARGLPEDLKYVAIVESSLRPEARSHAGAVGLWQFIAGTGERYNLKATSWLDERQDPVKSTEAALSYLEDLYKQFGDWFLAVAAYNAGEERIRREMARQRVNTFFDLVLPSETERYVFRIAAAKVILRDPSAYGFEVTPEDLYAPFKTERLEVQVERGELDMIAMAQACGMTYRALRELNPHIRGDTLPQGRFEIYVPAERAKEFTSFVKAALSRAAHGETKTASVPSTSRKEPARELGARKVSHLVAAGETLWDIAQKYRVNVRALQEWNQLGDRTQIRPGQRITVYR
jgi:membrane-bound lytic murein transglycosylase D